MRQTRVTVAAIGVLFVLSAASYWASPPSDILGPPWFWASWTLLAGLACIIFAQLIDSGLWWQISRIGVVVGVLARVGSVLTRYSNGAIDGWMTIAGVSLLLIGTLSLHRMWSVDLRYWSQRAAATGEHHHGGGVGGEYHGGIGGD